MDSETKQKKVELVSPLKTGPREWLAPDRSVLWHNGPGLLLSAIAHVDWGAFGLSRSFSAFFKQN